jgi:hypothetical protein
LPALGTLIQHKDTSILVDTVSALHKLTVGGNNDNDPAQQLAMDAGFCKQIVPLLGHSEAKVQKAALCSLKKFVADATHAQIQLVLDCGAVQMIKPFLFKEHILNEVCAFLLGLLEKIEIGIFYQNCTE